MARPLSLDERMKVNKEKSRRNDSTTDNDSTNMQMVYWANLYQASDDVCYRDALSKGVEYLLSG